jgi:hypothetical protein
MMRALGRTTTVASMAALIGASPLAAQYRQPATVPTVLALAMLGPYSELTGEKLRFFVGHAPDGWPSALLPAAPAEIVGGTAMGPSRALVYRSPRRTDAVPEYQRALARAGFVRRGADTPQRGFTSDRYSALPAYCSGTNSALVVQIDSTATTRTVLVSLSPRAMSMCDAAVEQSPESIHSLLELPALTAPAGSVARAEGTSYGGDNMQTSARLDTLLSTDALLSHYARQLADAGWRTGERTAGAGTATQRLSARDSRGEPWSGVLMVITAGDGRDVVLRMRHE